MKRRPPFVSGLPGREPLSGGASPAGLAMLARIRARAAAEAELLEPATRVRFDGCERTLADPEAVADKEICDAVVALVDCIAADKVLQLRIAALLARRVR